MKHFLIVVDIQKDFVDGSLGTAEAAAMIPAAVRKIQSFDGTVFVTYDTHSENYLSTAEGKKLPIIHCVKGTDGWELDTSVANALERKEYIAVEKPTFGAVNLPHLIAQKAGDEDFDVEIIGLCTDICVVSNALILKAAFCDKDISVDASCCAGVTPASHDAALLTMQMCQINVKNKN